MYQGLKMKRHILFLTIFCRGAIRKQMATTVVDISALWVNIVKTTYSCVCRTAPGPPVTCAC